MVANENKHEGLVVKKTKEKHVFLIMLLNMSLYTDHCADQSDLLSHVRHLLLCGKNTENLNSLRKRHETTSQGRS